MGAGGATLSVRGITKRFGDVVALNHVDFDLVPGEIHALLGENGAGKSTLMNVLRGLTPPTAGTITLGGQPVRFTSPQDASRAGIGMVHQHFLLVPPFTVAENLALASPDRRPPLREAREIAQRLGWTIPLNARVADLPVGTQQRVEILKALLGDARILLFDEPTAVLAPTEIGELFTVLRALRDEGRSLVFVSHKLNEVMALCDRVTVLRRGRAVGTVAVADERGLFGAGCLQGGELAVDKAGRHEVVVADGLAAGDEGLVAMQVDEADIRAISGQDVAVAAAQGRAGENAVAAGGAGGVDPGGHGLQPGPAVLVGQGRAAVHLGDVGKRVEIVGVDVFPAQAAREQGSDRGLAGPGDAHDEQDGGKDGVGHGADNSGTARGRQPRGHLPHVLAGPL